MRITVLFIYFLLHLILETIEVSSSSKAKINSLLEDNERLRRENAELRDIQQSNQV